MGSAPCSEDRLVHGLRETLFVIGSGTILEGGLEHQIGAVPVVAQHPKAVQRPERDNPLVRRSLLALTGLTVQQRDYVSIDHSDLLRHAYSTCRPHYEALFAHRLMA